MILFAGDGKLAYLEFYTYDYQDVPPYAEKYPESGRRSKLVYSY